MELTLRKHHMPNSAKELKEKALGLPPRERAELARDLIASLEPIDDGDVESEWIQEAERRYKEYREGKLKARPAEEALQSARNSIS